MARSAGSKLCNDLSSHKHKRRVIVDSFKDEQTCSTLDEQEPQPLKSMRDAHASSMSLKKASSQTLSFAVVRSAPSCSLPSLKPLLHKVVALVDCNHALGNSNELTEVPLFEAIPPAVFFVGFEQNGVYEAVLRLRLV
ncbi:hypothetical protein Esti_006051 [Eimeria stiedai]